MDVAHVLGDTAVADYTNDLTTALQAAAAGADGVTASGTTLTFTGGSGNDTNLDFSLIIADDTATESLENFQIGLSNPQTDAPVPIGITKPSAATTILDNDNLIEFSVSGTTSVTEDGSDADNNQATYTCLLYTSPSPRD